ncbi:AraC family transcriptional regulator [Paenibacillus hodogayensis]|uniref:AraC family transcriptional regulator n=1 Tax=Paenibacillus hodogayensis TaxID=279208 RepID=A0ABV5VTQ1_9BACL
MIPSGKRQDPSVGKRFPFRMSHVSRQVRGFLVTPHWHDHLEFIKIVEGRVTVTLDNQTFTAERDDILYINSRQVHAIAAHPDVPAQVKGMIFDRLFVTNLLEGFETRHIYSLFVQANRVCNPIRRNDPLWETLNRELELADDEYKRKEICYEMTIKSCIYRMLTTLMRSYAKQLPSLEKDEVSLRPALQYIEEKFAERLSLEEVSRLISRSPSRFSRLFKEVTGLTFTDYLAATRINMAKQMLVTGQWTITEIAEKTGFCNVHYFGKVFKEAAGLSPLQFRNEALRKGFLE